MLVSGGKVIAIDSIKKNNTNKSTLSGDGVWTDLGVNTDNIATTAKVESVKNELNNKIDSTKRTLENEINTASANLKSDLVSVSSKLDNKIDDSVTAINHTIDEVNTNLTNEINKKQDELKFVYNEFGKIVAVGPATGTTSALAGGNNVEVSAGANTRVDTTSAGEKIIYTVNVTANPTNVTVSGENGLTARRNDETSAFILGIQNDYINAITSVSSKLPTSTFNDYVRQHETDDVTPYTQGPNIDITNHIVSGKDWTDTIKNASANAVTTVDNKFNGTTSYSAYSGIPFVDNTTPKWSVAGDGNRISVTDENNIYKVNWNSAGFATEEWVTNKNYLPKAEASSTYLTIASAENIYQKILIPGAGIVIKNETDISVDISVSGDIVPYSAGKGIAIDEHVISISADYLSANALDEIAKVSANWNTAYETLTDNSARWDEVSAKLNSATFTAVSSYIQNEIDYVSGCVDYVSAGIDGVSAEFNDHNTNTARHITTEERTDWNEAAKKLVDSASYWNDTYTSSTIWNKTTEDFNTSSKLWNDVYGSATLWNETKSKVDTSSTIWNTVTAKLDTEDFTNWSANYNATITSFSAEFTAVSSNYASHSANTLIHIQEGEREKWDAVTDKLDTTAFNEWSATTNDWDKTEYSGRNGIKVQNHWIEVSADYALSADVDTRLEEYYDKDEVDKLIANFGGYTTATSAEPDGHPDVEKIDSRRIYLVKMGSGPTSADNYKEWIYIDTASAWNCVGETTMDLTPYLTKEEAGRTYQPIGDYVVSSTDVIKPGSAWVLINDNDNVQWSGLDVSELGKKYIVKSTNGTIGVGSATVGNVVTYDLSGATIVGENGVSAEYNPVTNEWNVGLEKTNLIAFGKFHSNINTYTTSAALTGFVQEDIVGDDIYLNEGKVYVNSGLYHIDIQVEVTVPGTNNEYYNTILKSTISPTRQIQQEIDGSYAHTETIDLSFDNRYADDTELEFTIENLPTNASIYVKNLNIHRIICSLAEIEGGLQYQAGDAIKIENNTINLDYGDGLELSGNKIQVKLGEGLKFDENAGVKAITINNEVEEVVETVTAIATDLDTKISNNFPPAMITVADADIAQYRNNGALYGTLFNVSINQAVEIDRSMIGMYIYRVDNNMNVVFGLYEYQPDYPRYIDDNPESGISAYGRTVPLCDTGVVQLTTATKGFCEWPIKNLNKTIGDEYPETRPSLKSSCMYYATIYMGSDLQAGGLHIGSFSGYAPQFNDIKPGLTISNDNINCSLAADYSSAVSFNDFGFGWKYNNYANHYAGTDNTYSTGNYSENNGGYRFYMQIRNKAKEA